MCDFFLFWQGTPTIFGCSKIFFCSSIKIFIQLHKVCQHFSECIRLVVLKHKVLIICVYVCAFLSVQIRLFLTHSVKRLRSIALTIHTEGNYQEWFCCCCYCYYYYSISFNTDPPMYQIIMFTDLYYYTLSPDEILFFPRLLVLV